MHRFHNAQASFIAPRHPKPQIPIQNSILNLVSIIFLSLRQSDSADCYLISWKSTVSICTED